jgi:putative flippase GtrA
MKKNRRSIVRYVAIGSFGFAVEFAVILVAETLGAPGTIAVAISFVIGFIMTFLLQKIITFQNKSFKQKLLLWQIIAYSLLVGWNFIFTIVVTALLESFLPVVLIRAIALAITVLWNYYIYKNWIFKKHTDEIPQI